MAAPVPAQFVPLVAAINAAFGGNVATQADINFAVAPLATKAQVNALAAQVAALPTIAQLQELLVPHNAPAIAAAAVATVQAITAARSQNAHDRSGVDYVVVPRSDGTPPPNWPLVGFDRAVLIRGNIAIINSLLNDYGLLIPAQANVRDRRDILAQHIGTMRS